MCLQWLLETIFIEKKCGNRFSLSKFMTFCRFNSVLISALFFNYMLNLIGIILNYLFYADHNRFYWKNNIKLVLGQCHNLKDEIFYFILKIPLNFV